MNNTRMHTIPTDFPKPCELCEYEIKSISDLKKHLKFHSYKEINFKCTECEYFCEIKLEMEAHIGNKHNNLNVDSVALETKIWKG